jgi:signal transduction histidine kinase
MKKRLKAILLLICLFFEVSLSVFSQNKTIDDLKVAMTLKICQYVHWPTDTNKRFTITLLSDNENLKNKFISISNNFNLNNKHIVIKIIHNPDSIPNTQVLFVEEAQSEYIQALLNKINKRNILLFTENYKISKDIMFNLLPNPYKGSITFELNRTNLIFEGFEIDNEIIELRGSEIDIREMYRQTKLRLEKEENKVGAMQNKIDSQKTNIEKQNFNISKLNTFIEKLNSVVDSQTYDISIKESVLKSLKKITTKQENNIHKNLSVIKKQENLLTSVNSSLLNQNEKISKQKAELETLNKTISEKQKDISRKETVLAAKDVLINFKNNLLYLLAALMVLVFTVVFLIFKAYRTNRAAQEILSKQKNELEVTLAKLTQAQAQLVQSEKMASLGILTSGIAHEINNPVNFINSGIHGLQKINTNILKVLQKYREKYGDLPSNKEIEELETALQLPFLLESSPKLISNIQTGVDRTVNIINSLRAFARSDEEEKKLINIHDNIDLALTILYNQYKYKIEIIRNYGDIPQVTCYPGKINQVFMNILTNAIQAIPEKGTIAITTSFSNGFVIVSIKDSGTGIPEKIKNKIFDPFFTTKEVGKGTGMGLSIVFSIAEEHNGSVDVISELGKGSEFFVKLPAENNQTKNQQSL